MKEEEFLKNIKSLREQAAKRFNKSEEEIGNSINDFVRISKKYNPHIHTIHSAANTLNSSIALFGLYILKDDSITSKDSVLFYKSLIDTVIHRIITKFVPEEEVEQYINNLSKSFKDFKELKGDIDGR